MAYAQSRMERFWAERANTQTLNSVDRLVGVVMVAVFICGLFVNVRPIRIACCATLVIGYIRAYFVSGPSKAFEPWWRRTWSAVIAPFRYLLLGHTSYDAENDWRRPADHITFWFIASLALGSCALLIDLPWGFAWGAVAACFVCRIALMEQRLDDAERRIENLRKGVQDS